jgi:hypothetical protein
VKIEALFMEDAKWQTMQVIWEDVESTTDTTDTLDTVLVESDWRSTSLSLDHYEDWWNSHDEEQMAVRASSSASSSHSMHSGTAAQAHHQQPCHVVARNPLPRNKTSFKTRFNPPSSGRLTSTSRNDHNIRFTKVQENKREYFEINGMVSLDNRSHVRTSSSQTNSNGRIENEQWDHSNNQTNVESVLSHDVDHYAMEFNEFSQMRSPPKHSAGGFNVSAPPYIPRHKFSRSQPSHQAQQNTHIPHHVNIEHQGQHYNHRNKRQVQQTEPQQRYMQPHSSSQLQPQHQCHHQQRQQQQQLHSIHQQPQQGHPNHQQMEMQMRMQLKMEEQLQHLHRLQQQQQQQIQKQNQQLQLQKHRCSDDLNNFQPSSATLIGYNRSVSDTKNQESALCEVFFGSQHSPSFDFDQEVFHSPQKFPEVHTHNEHHMSESGPGQCFPATDSLMKTNQVASLSPSVSPQPNSITGSSDNYLDQILSADIDDIFQAFEAVAADDSLQSSSQNVPTNRSDQQSPPPGFCTFSTATATVHQPPLPEFSSYY